MTHRYVKDNAETSECTTTIKQTSRFDDPSSSCMESTPSIHEAPFATDAIGGSSDAKQTPDSTLVTIALTQGTPVVGSPSAEDQWKQSLDTCIDSVVSIRFVVTRNFDTWQVGSYTATGFIVDADRGIILTNKHVVTDAPFVGKVCFRNSEEASAWPLWRDPVHDFGFLRFDKDAVKYMELKAIPLNPSLARVGLSVRVPGSDAGEKLAVLSGIIARIDRPAANYGIGNYCDFNTFYIQASANTSGGSSGSPVINENGTAVAMNAGGSNHAASSFFLPLYRVKHALDLIVNSVELTSPVSSKIPTHSPTSIDNTKKRIRESVPRGTLQVEFIQKQYDECRRLGLHEEIERQFREKSPDLNGVLAVKSIVPNGPAYGRLVTGDLLIKIGDKLINHFVELADALDTKSEPWSDDTFYSQHHPLAKNDVGEFNPSYSDVTTDLKRPYVTLTVFRNREYLEIDVMVDSLHRISPDMYVEVGGSVLHPLSYQLARSYLHPVGSIFVSDAGQMLGVAGIPNYSIITAIDHIPVPDIATFIDVVRRIPTDKRVPVKYYTLSKKNVEIIKIVVMEKKWGRFRVAKKNDEQGIWDYYDIDDIINPTSQISRPQKVRYLGLDPTRGLHSKLTSKLIKSLCVCENHTPFGIHGHNTKWAEGVGVIVDHKTGVVVVGKATVSTPLAKLYITLANNVIIPAKLLWFHPLHNIVVVRFDVSMLGGYDGEEMPVESVEFSKAGPLLPGDDINLVSISGITHTPRVVSTKVKAKGHFIFNDSNPPRHRTINWDDGITVLDPLTEESSVLVDNDGKCRGFWHLYPENNSFIGTEVVEGVGLHEYLSEIIEVQRHVSYQQSGKLLSEVDFPLLRCVDAEFTETYYWKARELGLSEEWIEKIAQTRSERLTSFLDKYAETANVNDKSFQQFRAETSNSAISCGLIAGTDKYTITTVRRVPAVITGSETQTSPFNTLSEGDLVLAYRDPKKDIARMNVSSHKTTFIDDDDIIPITQMSGPLVDIINPKNCRPIVDKDGLSHSAGWPLTLGTYARRSEMETYGVHMKDTLDWSEDFIRGLTETNEHSSEDRERINLIILRDGKEMEVQIPRITISGVPRVDIVHWAGAILQEPHRIISLQVKHIPKGLYISLMFNGTPSQRDQMSACWFVTEVDGQPVTDIDSFLRLVEGDDYESCVPVINPVGNLGWNDPNELFKLQVQQESSVVKGSGNSGALSTIAVGQSPSSWKGVPNQDVLKDILQTGTQVRQAIPQKASTLCAKCQLESMSAKSSPTVSSGYQSPRDSAVGGSSISADSKVSPVSSKVPLINTKIGQCSTCNSPISMNHIKATIARSYRVRLVSLEQVQKVITVDVDLASKNYWPTWRTIVE